MTDCLFCKIAAREIPADIVWSDQEFVAFRDIHPQAPTHLLVIPRAHFDTVAVLAAADVGVTGRLMLAATALAESQGIAESGYRLVFNTGAAAGQTVMHVHVHLLGGRQMGWPPG